MEFLRISGERLVHAHTAGNIQPIQNVVRKGCVQHEAVFLVFTHISVVDPVRVLHGHAGSTYRPVLGVEFSVGIVTLEHPVLFPVVTSREQICTDQRVIVGTLVDHVAVFL